MKTVDALTATAHTEMLGMARWMIEKQNYPGINHLIEPKHGKVGDKHGRRDAQVSLLKRSTADFFILADDDDYLPSGYISLLVHSIGEAPVYGEIPDKIYYMPQPSWGQGTKRTELLSTFTLYSASVREEMLQVIDSPIGLKDVLSRRVGAPPINQGLIIMRGLMRDPNRAITKKKNTANPEVFTHQDPDYLKLREWVGEEDFSYYARWIARARWL